MPARYGTSRRSRSRPATSWWSSRRSARSSCTCCAAADSGCSGPQRQALHVFAETGADLRVLERQFDGRLEETLLAAAVEALALVLIRVHPFGVDQARDRVGQLDFPAGAAWIGADEFEHGRREDVAAGNAHARGRRGGARLLDHLPDLQHPLAGRIAGHDAIALDLVQR